MKTDIDNNPDILVPVVEKTKKEKKPRKKSIFCGGLPIKRIRGLKIGKQDFKVVCTNRTTRIFTKDATYVYGCGGGLSFIQLNRFVRMKAEAKRNIAEKDLAFPKKEYTDVKYFNYTPKLLSLGVGEVLDQCTSFDVNMAYYNAAYNLGIIGDEFYRECQDLDKPDRLMLIGCLATKKRHSVYVSGHLVARPYSVYNEELRSAWFNIVANVNECLESFANAAGNRFLFYWVDGIYLIGKEEDYDGIKADIKQKFKLDFKTEPINQIAMQLDKKGNQILAVYKKELEKAKDPDDRYKKFYVTRIKENYYNENTD